jgi:hypothetical protein
MMKHVMRGIIAVAAAASTVVAESTIAGSGRQAGVAIINVSTDVGWLEAVAGDDVTAERMTSPHYLPGGTRRAAYTRLGQLGTPAAIEALQRIETAASQTHPARDLMREADWAHPAPHVGAAPREPVATLQATDGSTLAIVGMALTPGGRISLMRGQRGDWRRPKLIPHPVEGRITEAALTAVRPGVLRLTYTETPYRRGVAAPATREITVAIEEIELDSDGDGWTDLEERALGLDPTRADTDGDGLDDGHDACPNHAAPADEAAATPAQIIRKAAFVMFGLNRSRRAIAVEGQSRRVQLFGFHGPVIYVEKGLAPGDRLVPWSAIVNWRIVRQTEDEAEVELTDYEGALSGGKYRVRLASVRGVWVVTEQRMTAIS